MPIFGLAAQICASQQAEHVILAEKQALKWARKKKQRRYEEPGQDAGRGRAGVRRRASCAHLGAAEQVCARAAGVLASAGKRAHTGSRRARVG